MKLSEYAAEIALIESGEFEPAGWATKEYNSVEGATVAAAKNLKRQIDAALWSLTHKPEAQELSDRLATVIKYYEAGSRDGNPGSRKSEAKAEAARANGAKGGRPKKAKSNEKQG